MKYSGKLVKTLKIFLIAFLSCCLVTGGVFAQEEISLPIPDVNPLGVPGANMKRQIEKVLETEIPGLVTDSEGPPPQEKQEKPDVCGEIIFDPTVWEVPITLEESLSIVLDKNFDIGIFFARKNREKWRYYQTITNWLPDITYEFRIGYLEGQFLADFIIPESVSEIPIESNFLLNQNISARKWFLLKEALFEFNSARKDFDFTRDEALLEAARAYYELLRTKVDIEILEINVKQIEEQFRLNKQRVEAGVGTQFDVFRAEADRDRAIQRLLRRKNSYRLAQAQLANILGLPVFLQLVPNDKDIFIKEILCDCFTLERAAEIAICERDDLAAQRFDIRAARQRRNLGYSVYIPEINIRGQLAQQGTADAGIFPNGRIELFIDWNFLRSLGLFGYTEVRARQAEIQEQKLIYMDRARDIQESLVGAFSDVITERLIIETTATELEAAEKAREISLIRLQEEIGSFVDVIVSQTVYTDARVNYLEAITNYNISQIELLFEMGVISVDSILCGFNSGAYEPNTNQRKDEKFNRALMEELRKLEKNESIKKPGQQRQIRQLPRERGILRDQEPGSGGYPLR